MSKPTRNSPKHLPAYYEGAIYADTHEFKDLEEAIFASPYDFDTPEGQEWVAGAYAKRSLQDYEEFSDPTQLTAEEFLDLGAPSDDEDD